MFVTITGPFFLRGLAISLNGSQQLMSNFLEGNLFLSSYKAKHNFHYLFRELFLNAVENKLTHIAENITIKILFFCDIGALRFRTHAFLT